MTRDLQLGKLSAIATFSDIWPELTNRLCAAAAESYRAGLADGLTGGIANPTAGEHDAIRRTAAVLNPMLDEFAATAQTIFDDLDHSPRPMEH